MQFLNLVPYMLLVELVLPAELYWSSSMSTIKSR